eukprot:scaffold3289_cov362-Prasinococcus_capsulatus_cf.AAC.7
MCAQGCRRALPHGAPAARAPDPLRAALQGPFGPEKGPPRALFGPPRPVGHQAGSGPRAFQGLRARAPGRETPRAACHTTRAAKRGVGAASGCSLT